MASPSGSPRRGRTLVLDGIPHDTHPSEVLEWLQAVAGRLQRASTTRSSPSMVHSLDAQQRQQQRQQQVNGYEPASIPVYPSQQRRVYSVKVEFSTREGASKACDLLTAQPQPPLANSQFVPFGYTKVAILPNFVLDEEDPLLDIPVIISRPLPSHSHSPSPSPEETHGRRTSAEEIGRAHLCVPVRAEYNNVHNNGNNACYGAQQHNDIIIAFPASTSLSSASSLATSPSPQRHPHSSSQSQGSTSSSVSPRSSPSGPPHHLTPPMEPAFSLLPFDSRDPFHPQHPPSGLQDNLLFDASPITRPKLPSALRALDGYSTPACPTHSRSSSYGQTPTATTYQPSFPQTEWRMPQRLHASAASSPPMIPGAPTGHDPTPTREGYYQQNQQPQMHSLCHTPSGEMDKQYYLPVPPSTADALAPTLATDDIIKKLDFRAALTANSVPGARPHLATHNRSQSMGVRCGVNRPAITPQTTHCHARSASVAVVGSNNTTNSSRPNPNATRTDANGNNKGNGAHTHKRSRSSASSASTSVSACASAENHKTYAFDPHRGPRSTDWMLSPETLAARPHKDAKFAHMVALGLARGRTKAGWAQARRPGKRDRDAAKRKLAEELELARQAAQAEGLSVDEVVAGIRNMAVAQAQEMKK